MGEFASAEGVRGHPMDHARVQKAYATLSPLYDFLFDRIFYPGRVAAIELLGIRPGDRVLEVGIGTGLNLPLYPRGFDMVGVDISEEMLAKARDKVIQCGMTNVTLKVMDASALQFPDRSFDRILATYVISAVPDPVKTLLEMKRVCRPGGTIVFVNHFRSEKLLWGFIEKLVAPLFTWFGFKTDLRLRLLLRAVGLQADAMFRVNLLGGWRLVRCSNPA